MVRAFLQCESHSGRLLTDHLRDVADRLAAHPEVPVWLPLTGLFHDLGKATNYFQKYLQGLDVSHDLKRHAEMGALWLLEFMRHHLRYETSHPLDTALAFLFVRRHHGRLDDLLDALSVSRTDLTHFEAQLSSMDLVGIREWFSAQLKCSIPIATIDDQAFTKLRVHSKRALQGLRTDADAMNLFQSALRWFGLLIESDRDSAAGYPAAHFDGPPALTFAHMERFRAASGFGTSKSGVIGKARELIFEAATRSVARCSPKKGAIWTLTVPTGAGKTLAALGWALRRREARIAVGRRIRTVIYALPFTSIIDQNARVARQLFGEHHPDESLLAVHHHVAEPGEIARDGEESLARAWVNGWRSEIICTTFVQVVNALFHATTSDARRFSRLAGSILIIDEVQAFPAELWPVLRVSLQSLCHSFGTDILLVTATQPALFADSDRVELGPDLPADVCSAFDRYDVKVNTRDPLCLKDLCSWICDEQTRDDRTSCLVIANTVQEALDLHTMLGKLPELRDYTLFHLSTNLRPKDRARILGEIASCRGRHIVVSTQVVEAGVDLSFDVVFRCVAPLDAIVQAAGRCNRHGAGRRGLVCVFDLEGHRGASVYGPTHVGLAREVLHEVNGSSRLREPELTSAVTHYFRELDRRVSHDRAEKIFEAIRMLQFASLRGEGEDRERHKKRVQLIEDETYRIPHFVETDSADASVWLQLMVALAIPDLRERQNRLRVLRHKISQRVVEVPARCAAGAPDPISGLVYVPLHRHKELYDRNTGWRRNV